MAQQKQRPTLEGVHIRSADDAHKVFYAVMQKKLNPITKRLDAEERAALKAGDVYVWARQTLAGDAYSPHMERFTEGKSWTASRVRDEFLIYYEIPEKAKGRGAATQRAESSENRVVRQGEHDQFIKQTYSVYCNDPEDTQLGPDGKPKEPRKWHLNAYFTKLTEGQLQTIDDIDELHNLEVPEGMFKSARTSKASKKGESSRTTSSTKRTYAPFPSRSQPPQASTSTQPPPQPSTSQPPPPSPAQGPSMAHDPQSGPSTSTGYQYLPSMHQYEQYQRPEQYPQTQQFQQTVGWPGPVSASASASAPPPAPSDRVPQYAMPTELQPPLPVPFPTQPAIPPADTLTMIPNPDDDPAGPTLPESIDEYTPAPIPPGMSLLGPAQPQSSLHIPEPNYEYGASSASPVLGNGLRSRACMSPSLSERSSSSSWSSRSAGSASSPSPSLSYSRYSSPLFGMDGFPLTDAGLPYTPAPALEDMLGERVALGPARVDLAPLSSLRSHPYRRCPADDRALRLLGPGAR